MNDTLQLPQPAPLLVVLSGPSGVGKDVVLQRLRQEEPSLTSIVTVTTRPQRTGELDGVHYHFVDSAHFQEMLDKGELLEWAQVYGSWYGVPRSAVREALAQGRDVVLKTDVQGAATIRKAVLDAVLAFLAPPSMEELARRLRARNTENPQQYQRRLETARQEMACLPHFDYVVVNRKVGQAVAQIRAILTAERCRVHPRRIQL